MPSFIILHPSLKLSTQKYRIDLVLSNYSSPERMQSLQIYASEDLTDVYEKEAAYNFVLGYATALRNLNWRKPENSDEYDKED